MNNRMVLAACVIVLVGGCGMLPNLSLTPINLETEIAGTHEGVEEDNLVKVQTGDTTVSEFVADEVSQVYNDVVESPPWLILAFAVALGLAIPSPVAAWSSYRRRKELQKHITMLANQLEKKT